MGQINFVTEYDTIRAEPFFFILFFFFFREIHELFTFPLDDVDYQHDNFCNIYSTPISSDVLLTDFIGLAINVPMIIRELTCALYFPSL